MMSDENYFALSDTDDEVIDNEPGDELEDTYEEDEDDSDTEDEDEVLDEPEVEE
jgi:hypothetical protein